MNPWLIVAMIGIGCLLGIMCILHIFCNKLYELLEGIILLMKYVLDKEHYNDRHDLFGNKDN